MLKELLQTRVALMVETLLAAGLLFGLGYETADRLADQEVSRARERAVRAVRDAVGLEREKAGLEQRLAEALARAGQPPAPAPPAAVHQESEADTAFRVLRRDRADLLLDGRLVVTLEEVGGGRPRLALVRLKVAGGQEGRKALQAGQEVRIRVDGRVYRLLVKEIFTSSMRYGLLPVN